jgi:hypothetical protein
VTFRRVVLTLVVSALVAALPGCGNEPGDGVSSADMQVERTFVGPATRVEDVTSDGSAVAVLTSTAGPGTADGVVVSTDAGETWTEHDTTLGALGGTPASEYWSIGPRARLWLVDGHLVAVRTVGIDSAPADGWSERLRQEVAISDDLGSSWRAVHLPASDGHVPIVASVAVHGATIVLVGAVQRADIPVTPDIQDFGRSMEAYDAAVWTSDDEGTTFRRAGTATFDGAPGQQSLSHVTWFDDRFVAIGNDSNLAVQRSSCCNADLGPSSFASPDGRTWTLLTGLDDGPGSYRDMVIQPPTVDRDGLVAVGFASRRVLGAGVQAWQRVELAGATGNYEQDVPATAQVTGLAADGSAAATWVMDSACDCEVAYGGHVGPDGQEVTRLRFDRCEDTSVRGQTGVGTPHRLGRTVVALAWCNDHDQQMAALATSTDDGRTWKTASLGPWAPTRLPGGADSGLAIRMRPTSGVRFAVPTDDAVVLALSAPDQRPAENGPDERPHPIVLLRVTPGS